MSLTPEEITRRVDALFRPPIERTDIFATRYISLMDHPWLDSLRGSGRAWEGAKGEETVLVVATIQWCGMGGLLPVASPAF